MHAARWLMHAARQYWLIPQNSVWVSLAVLRIVVRHYTLYVASLPSPYNTKMLDRDLEANQASTVHHPLHGMHHN